MKDVIEQETKRRMLEEHGSILLDGTLTERAQAATANETRDEVIRAEMRALGRKRREVAPFVKAERQKGAAAVAGEKALASSGSQRRRKSAPMSGDGSRRRRKLRIAIAEAASRRRSTSSPRTCRSSGPRLEAARPSSGRPSRRRTCSGTRPRSASQR
jgi:hypothetical protein